MSEFGLELPEMTKMGHDGKGPKAFVIKQTHVGGFILATCLLMLLYFGASADLMAQKSETSVQMQNSEHQRMAKLEAETKLQEVAAELSQQVGSSAEAESDLKIMAQHISYIQRTVLTNIHKSIDDETLNVAQIKKAVDTQFIAMEDEIEGIMHDHLVTVTDANKKSKAAMDAMHASLLAEMQQQEKEEELYREAQHKAHQANVKEDQIHAEKAEKGIQQIFDHVYALATKMGETDIDDLLKKDTVKEWEQLLTDTEEGKLSYDDAVTKMEDVLTKSPAALKLAEATNAFELIHADGGRKGTSEITNFRNLIKHVQWLPQYSIVIEKLTEWKQGKVTTQQALVWIQEQVKAKAIDDRWLVEAMKEPTAPTATGTASEAPASTTAAATATK